MTESQHSYEGPPLDEPEVMPNRFAWIREFMEPEDTGRRQNRYSFQKEKTRPDARPLEKDEKWNLKSVLPSFKKTVTTARDKQKNLNELTNLTKNEVEVDEETQVRAEVLISSFVSGCPAALVAGSMFLKDHNEVRRAPLLLTLLGVKIHDVTEKQTRKREYRLDLEYGVGPERLKWTVYKSYRDFEKLNASLRDRHPSVRGDRKVEMPKFPKLEHRLLSNWREGREHLANGHLANIHSTGHSTLSSSSEHIARESFEEYLFRLEKYIGEVLIVLSLRPQSNRIFSFFELSPIGVLLGSESGYQGRQGYIFNRTRSNKQGWRVGHLKASEISAMVKRHTPKWLMVRSSYLVYVADINSTTPLEVFIVDAQFKVTYKGQVYDWSNRFSKHVDESDDEDMALIDDDFSKTPLRYTVTVENSERKLKFLAESDRACRRWVESLTTMMGKTIFARPNRFGSFAPVRENVFAQWFVDARDHFWAVSSALEMARDVIYLHDWWLSPELYMRRPVEGNQHWRLDRILRRKAEEGVKIFVIVYRNVGNTVVTDSLWTKHSLLDLHKNVHVIRSPHQLLQNTYFWAHHEKLCVVDHTVCFVGGMDLCFGRFDTCDHALSDEDALVWPGKDYSNPRVRDFNNLEKPYDSMYDRQATPRMPWHDVHMVCSGQIARDLGRHFVQRWNYLVRQKRPSRPTPLLLPPSELSHADVDKMGLRGTCEVQLLRSACDWSLGLKEPEHSIQDAYLKLIETSEHFVYLENQFFVSSTAFEGTVIQNRIGDALVDRIIRAHASQHKWRAVCVIPLMPGFPASVDEPEGSSVRVIMQCQYMSISRGPTSLFGKLRKAGIEPEQYIDFFSLRKWGILGPNRHIVTEQLYVHAKTMIVDDRAAIIGSANINERSMRGNRDSEVAAIVRDSSLVETTMNGKPYQAAKFAHTLRLRLMREHLGVDIDTLDLSERQFHAMETFAVTNYKKCKTCASSNRTHSIQSAMVELASRHVLRVQFTEKWNLVHPSEDLLQVPLDCDLPHDASRGKFHPSFNSRSDNLGIRDTKPFSYDPRIANNADHKEDVNGTGADGFKSKQYRASVRKATEALKKWSDQAMRASPQFVPSHETICALLEEEAETDDETYQLDQQRWEMLKRISYLDRVASNQKNDLNTENKKRQKAGLLPRKASRDFVQGTQANDSNDSELPLGDSDRTAPFSNGDSVPLVKLDQERLRAVLDALIVGGSVKYIDPYGFEDPLAESFYEQTWYRVASNNTKLFRAVFHCQPDDTVHTWGRYKQFCRLGNAFSLGQEQEAELKKSNTAESSMRSVNTSELDDAGDLGRISSTSSEDPQRRKAPILTATRKSYFEDTVYDKETANRFLDEVQGHLVLFPTDWLKTEMEKGNWYYSADRIPPIEIYD